MARKTELPVPPKKELEALRTEGFSREEIATHYGVSLSRVKRWILHHDIKPLSVSKDRQKIISSNAKKRRTVGEDDGLTIIELIRVVLGKRITEDHRGYLLDGRPVRVDTLAKLAGLKIPDGPQR